MSYKIATVFSLALPFYCTAIFADAGDIQTAVPTIDQISQTTVFGTLGGKNPSTRHEYTDGPYIFGEVLYWRAEQEGLEYAVKSPTPEGQTPEGIAIGFPTLKGGKLIDIDFDWQPGMRVGLGYNLNHDEWDIVLEWTRLLSYTRKEAKVSAPGSLSPSWGTVSAGTGPANNAESRWDFKYNAVDFELGRDYFLTRALSARPFVGLRWVSIKENIHFKYTGQSFSVTDPIPAPTAPIHVGPLGVHARNNYYGGGARTGFDMNWRFGSHWSILGQGSASLVYGTFHVKMKSQTQTALTASPFDDSHRFNRTRTNLEGNIGIQWETNFNCDKCHVVISAAYELAQWFDMNQLIWYFGTTATPGIIVSNAIYLPHRGDLGMQGGTFTMRFDF